MESSSNCPKCKSEMEEGFVVDHGHFSLPSVSHWAKGPPKIAALTGTSVTDTKQIITFRCVGCGYLESYARDVEPS